MLDNDIVEFDNENNIIVIASHSLIVGILNNPSAFDLARGRLEPNDFNIKEDRLIYKAIIEFKENNKNFDYLEIAKYIDAETNGSISCDSMYLYITSLIKNYPDVWDVSSYIRIIENYNIELALKQFGKELLTLNLEANSCDQIIAKISSDFNEIINRRKTDALSTINEILELWLDKIKKNQGRNINEITGTTTGYPSLNAITNGWQPGDMIIIAARPSIGKTALALNFLYNAAIECKNENNEVVVMFSLEMSAEQVAQRLISIHSNISSSRLRSGNLSNDELFTVENSLTVLSFLPILICDNSNISIFEIQSKLYQLSKTHNIKLVIVDYLQLVECGGGYSSNRANEVAKISRTLKIIARNINAPIIAIAQLSRKIEERKGDDRRPLLSDLRESGSIEQDADIVTFIDYDRNQVDNNKNTNNDNSGFKKQFSQSVIVDFYISKHRNGATGMVNLNYKKDTGRYQDALNDKISS